VSGATRSTNELMVLTFVPKPRKATKPSFPQLREISHIDDAKTAGKRVGIEKVLVAGGLGR
jgi:hypothetical protein